MHTYELTHRTTMFFHKFLVLIILTMQVLWGRLCSSCSSSANKSLFRRSWRWWGGGVFLTCENAARLGCHVNLVLPGDVQHHGFGAPVVLGGQQPAQRLWKEPAELGEADR